MLTRGILYGVYEVPIMEDYLEKCKVMLHKIRVLRRKIVFSVHEERSDLLLTTSNYQKLVLRT